MISILREMEVPGFDATSRMHTYFVIMFALIYLVSVLNVSTSSPLFYLVVLGLTLL